MPLRVPRRAPDKRSTREKATEFALTLAVIGIVVVGLGWLLGNLFLSLLARLSN